MSSTPLQILNDFLREAGYRVLFRKRGWIECLVFSGQERWIGREATEEQALWDALRQMFPSGAAHDLLERGLSVRTERTVEGEQSLVRGVAIASSLEATLVAAAPPQAKEESSVPAGGAAPPADSRPQSAVALSAPAKTEAAPMAALDETLVVPGSSLKTQGTPGKSSASPKVAVTVGAALNDTLVAPRSRSRAPDTERMPLESAAQTTKEHSPETTRGGSAPPPWGPASPPDSVSFPVHTPSGLDAFGTSPTLRQQPTGGSATDRKSNHRVKGAVQAVESLIAGIDGDDKRLASMSPQRLRLWVLYWICHARSYEETLPDEVDVARAVARVAKRLTELCKRFWPGNIRALQLHARPGEAGVGGPAATWREAEGMARRLLDDHIKQGAQNGLDAEGWADAAALLPRPADPAAMLAEMTEIVTRLTGALDASPELTSAPTDATVEDLAVVTQKLRWLRGTVDPERWGLMMGRVRWLAQELGVRGARIKGLLDPLHQQVTPWAALFAAEGEDPQQVEAVTDLLHGRPGPGTDREALAAWIVRALDVLDTAQIAMVLSPVRSEVRDLDPASLPAPGRRVRRRFRDLVARLPNGDDALEPPRSATSTPSNWSTGLLSSETPAKAPASEPARAPTSTTDPLSSE